MGIQSSRIEQRRRKRSLAKEGMVAIGRSRRWPISSSSFVTWIVREVRTFDRFEANSRIDLSKYSSRIVRVRRVLRKDGRRLRKAGLTCDRRSYSCERAFDPMSSETRFGRYRREFQKFSQAAEGDESRDSRKMVSLSSRLEPSLRSRMCTFTACRSSVVLCIGRRPKFQHLIREAHSRKSSAAVASTPTGCRAVTSRQGKLCAMERRLIAWNIGRKDSSWPESFTVIMKHKVSMLVYRLTVSKCWRLGPIVSSRT